MAEESSSSWSFSIVNLIAAISGAFMLFHREAFLAYASSVSEPLATLLTIIVWILMIDGALFLILLGIVVLVLIGLFLWGLAGLTS